MSSFTELIEVSCRFLRDLLTPEQAAYIVEQLKHRAGVLNDAMQTAYTQMKEYKRVNIARYERARNLREKEMERNQTLVTLPETPAKVIRTTPTRQPVPRTKSSIPVNRSVPSSGYGVDTKERQRKPAPKLVQQSAPKPVKVAVAERDAEEDDVETEFQDLLAGN